MTLSQIKFRPPPICQGFDRYVEPLADELQIAIMLIQQVEGLDLGIKSVTARHTIVSWALSLSEWTEEKPATRHPADCGHGAIRSSAWGLLFRSSVRLAYMF
jgi:hypothetical protein